MRHNQNGRRFRGRGNGGGGHQGQQHGHHHHSSGGNNNRRANPRVQTFDSNGPDVRIRGNAYQINEKYQALARDAASAGDRVLAESYHQHAEHYLRMINEMTEEYARYNPQFQQGQQQPVTGEEPQPIVETPGTAQPAGNMSDLDQGFLVGPRPSNGSAPAADGPQPDVAGEERPQRRHHHRQTEQV